MSFEVMSVGRFDEPGAYSEHDVEYTSIETRERSLFVVRVNSDGKPSSQAPWNATSYILHN